MARGKGVPSDAILELEPIVRSVIEGRVTDASIVDDLTQETITRLLEAQGRLDRTTLASYAVMTARNLAISHQRGRDIEQRHAPRLVDPKVPPIPEDEALRAEDRAALAAALRQLSPEERDALVAHDVAGVDTTRVARELKTTPGAAGMRLTRARAKLRVEYLIALTQVRLPTPRCRSVLVAISAGDKRRQASLGAADHILECPVCSRLSDDALHRRRPLPVVIPALMGYKLRDALRTTPGKAAAVTVVGVGAALLAMSFSDGEPSRSPQSTALAIQGRVEGVPSDEGFWLTTEDRRDVWVEIVVTSESGPEVDPGDRVHVRGRREQHDASYAKEMGVTQSEGSAKLTRLGWHVVVSQRSLKVRGGNP